MEFISFVLTAKLIGKLFSKLFRCKPTIFVALSTRIFYCSNFVDTLLSQFWTVFEAMIVLRGAKSAKVLFLMTGKLWICVFSEQNRIEISVHLPLECSNVPRFSGVEASIVMIGWSTYVYHVHALLSIKIGSLSLIFESHLDIWKRRMF